MNELNNYFYINKFAYAVVVHTINYYYTLIFKKILLETFAGKNILFVINKIKFKDCD